MSLAHVRSTLRVNGMTNLCERAEAGADTAGVLRILQRDHFTSGNGRAHYRWTKPSPSRDARHGSQSTNDDGKNLARQMVYIHPGVS